MEAKSTCNVPGTSAALLSQYVQSFDSLAGESGVSSWHGGNGACATSTGAAAQIAAQKAGGTAMKITSVITRSRIDRSLASVCSHAKTWIASFFLASGPPSMGSCSGLGR